MPGFSISRVHPRILYVESPHRDACIFKDFEQDISVIFAVESKNVVKLLNFDIPRADVISDSVQRPLAAVFVQYFFDDLPFVRAVFRAKPDFPDEVFTQIEGRKLECQCENAKTGNTRHRHKEHIRTTGDARPHGREHKNDVARVLEIRAEIDDGQSAQYADTCCDVVANGLQDHGGDKRTEYYRLKVVGSPERPRGSEIINGRNKGRTQERQEKGKNDHFKGRIFNPGVQRHKIVHDDGYRFIKRAIGLGICPKVGNRGLCRNYDNFGANSSCVCMMPPHTLQKLFLNVELLNE